MISRRQVIKNAVDQPSVMLPAQSEKAGGPTAGLSSRINLKRGQWSTSTILSGIIIAAVALRLASALYQGDSIAPLPGIADQISYDTLARQVLAGRGFSFPSDWWPATRAGEPTAHWSFLYTLYLTATYTLFGLHPLAARLIEAVIAGILHPLLIWRIGTRIFGPQVGLVAAGLTAFYIYFAYYAGALMTETFYIVAILWTLDLVTGAVQAMRNLPESPSARSLKVWGATRPQILRWPLLGLALGVAVLLRQVMLLLVPLLFIWILWTTGRQGTYSSVTPVINRTRQTVIGLILTMLVLAALITPWTARNYFAFGRFVLLNSNSGYAFFLANHPIYGTDFVPLLPESVYYDLIPAELRPLDEAALDQALLQEGIRFAIQDPSRYVRLSLSRIRSYFTFWPEAQSGAFSNLSRVLSFGILLPAMLYGLILSAASLGRYGRGSDRSMVVLLYLFIVVYSLIHLLTWSLIRYRLPVDALLLLFAAVAIANLGGRMIKRAL